MKREQSEFEKFDAVMGKILSVSHDELKAREAQWKKDRKRTKEKRAKKPASSRDLGA
jgi:hypothetical protein